MRAKVFLLFYFLYCWLILLFIPERCEAKFGVKIDLTELQKDSVVFYLSSNTIGVSVYVDSIFLGTTPIDSVRISTGRHVFKYIHPESRNWYYPAVIETVVIPSFDKYVRRIDFPFFYTIESEPSEAVVSYNDSIIGITPLVFSTFMENFFVKLSKENYQDITMALNKSQSNILVTLVPQNMSGVYNKAIYLKERSPSIDKDMCIVGGVTILSGAVAAYLKLKADDYYNDYKNTGNKNLRDRVKRLDVGAGVSLAICEISWLVLTYLLLNK